MEAAARFADELRRLSAQPVVYVELPGAQHCFDLFPSLRSERVVDGIETFAGFAGDRARATGSRVRRATR